MKTEFLKIVSVSNGDMFIRIRKGDYLFVSNLNNMGWSITEYHKGLIEALQNDVVKPVTITQQEFQNKLKQAINFFKSI